MKLTRSMFLCALLAASPLLSSACADEAGGGDGLDLRMALLGTCTGNENADRQFPSGSDRVVIELTGGAIAAGETFVAIADKESETAAGEVVLDGIPPGEGMTMRVVACNGESPVWAGLTHGVSVSAHTKSFPPVFMTPVGAVACTGSVVAAPGTGSPSEPRAFAALAANDEEAWAFGGFASFSLAQGGVATATSTIDHYERLTGELTSAGGLVNARGMALAQRLADGRVRVVGGASRVLVASGAPARPAIWAEPTDAPAAASEIYDPATGTSEVEEAAPLPAMPALVALPSGRVLAVGGVSAGGVGNPASASDNVTTFDGTGRASGSLPGARLGAAVAAIGDDLALVWGGNVDADAANVGLLVDASRPLASATTPLIITYTGAESVPIFAAAHRIGDATGGSPRVVIAGGNVIQAGGAGPSFPRDVSTSRLQVVTIDVAGGTATVEDVDATGAAGVFTRAAGTLTQLDGGDLWLYGGYTAFTSNALCGAADSCFQEPMVRFRIGQDGAFEEEGSRLLATVGPFGASAIALGDRSFLLIGGIATLAGDGLSADAALVRYAAFETDLCRAAASD